ncbi:hypothetical protein [Mycobacterium stomatepiae]|nr:hypothetical protein [Mycobacterium stomatepiae]
MSQWPSRVAPIEIAQAILFRWELHTLIDAGVTQGTPKGGGR